MPDHSLPTPLPVPGESGGARALSHYPDPAFVARFLAGVPRELADSFSDHQLFAIQQAFGPWDGKERRQGWHATMPTPWGRYSVSVRKMRG